MYIAMKRVSQLINNVSPIVHSSMVQCVSLRQNNFNTYIYNINICIENNNEKKIYENNN